MPLPLNQPVPKIAPQPGGIVLEYAVAMSAIGVLYVGFLPLFGVALPMLALSLLGLMVFRDSGLGENFFTQGLGVRLSIIMILLALISFALSAIIAFAKGALNSRDLALYVLQGILPVIMYLSPRRERIILAICQCAVFFAIFDGLANVLAVLGLIQVEMSGRSIDGAVRLRYAGLTGSTHAAGLVAFIAMSYMTWLIRVRKGNLLVLLALMAFLALSMYFIDARRYTIFVVVAALIMFGWRLIRPFGLQAVALGLATALLALTFLAGEDDQGNVLRALLLLNGIEQATQAPILGHGPTFIDDSEAEPTFESLSEVGITESYVLDLAKSYGIAPTGLFLLGIFNILRLQSKAGLRLPAIFLCIMTAEFFFGGSLRGFLGAILYFSCLFACAATIPPRRLRRIHPMQAAANPC
jgi:hypothetical protein